MNWHAVSVLTLTLFPNALIAQNIPDPDQVRPEYRDIAEKRRTEIIRQTACANKAAKEKVLKRDLASYINRCIDESIKAQQSEITAKRK